MTLDQLEKEDAFRIIEAVGSSGTPPEYGSQYFTVGLDDIIKVVEEHYLQRLIKGGGSSFKLVIGVYGTGKTHLLYTLRELAWKNNYATSFVPLTPQQTPFHKLDTVYSAIAKNLQPPLTPREVLSGSEKGIRNIMTRWLITLQARYSSQDIDKDEQKTLILKEVDSNTRGLDTSYKKAVKNALQALMLEDDETFDALEPWLKGEFYSRKLNEFGVVQKIDASTAFTRLQNLGQWIRVMGYNGLVVLFDEGELISTLSRKQKELLTSNLHLLINKTQEADFKGFMFFYAVPDTQFLNEPSSVFLALKQRVETFFTKRNPSGVRIDLDKLYEGEPEQKKRHYTEIGIKLADVYSIAYDHKFNENLNHGLELLAEKISVEFQLEAGRNREFVKRAVKLFHVLRDNPDIIVDQSMIDGLFSD